MSDGAKVIPLNPLPTGNTDEAVDFLRRWHGDAPITLIGIDPNGVEIKRGDYAPGEEERLRGVIEAHQGVLNLYCQVNICAPGKKKPGKADMVAARALHIDADFKDMGISPEEAVERARQFDPAPSIINLSGNGIWLLWLLDRPFADADWQARIETICKGLASQMGAAPGCANADRLMRVPGTINLPNEAKRKRGNVPVLARVIEADWNRTWSFADPVPKLPSISRSLADLPKKWQEKIKSGDHQKFGYASRSHMVFGIICECIRCGWGDDDILPLLIDSQYGAAAHCLENGGEKYARRQIAEAREKVAADWERNWRGIIQDSQRNVRRALSEMNVKLSYNEFDDRTTARVGDGRPKHFGDDVANGLRFAIEERFGFRPTKDFFFDFARVLSFENSHHPVRDYLAGLKWDGTKRIDTWLIRYANAKDTEYTRAVGRLILIAAARRVRQPGVKFDQMLILMDPNEGTGKSSLIEIMAVNPDWFTDEVSFAARGREMIEQLAGKWVVEFAELKGMSDSRIEHIKALLSRKRDAGRPAYARLQMEKERAAIFFGSSNELTPYYDGQNRRFWSVMTGEIDLDGIKRDRDQLWAEAAQREASGESIELPRRLWPEAAAIAAEHVAQDGWIEDLEHHLGGMFGRIAAKDVFTLLGVPTNQRDPKQTNRRSKAMRALGWEKKVARMGNVIVNCYVKPDENWDDTRVIYVHRDGDFRYFTSYAADPTAPPEEARHPLLQDDEPARGHDPAAYEPEDEPPF